MLDTAHLNEVNIIDHKILREMNCYSFIFGTKPLLHWTIPESTDVCFRVVLGGGGGGVLLGSGGGRCRWWAGGDVVGLIKSWLSMRFP